VLMGRGARDHLCAGRGPDTLRAATERGRLAGSDGDDVHCGGPGWDVLVGGPGIDALIGGRGHDVCIGGAGRDAIRTCEVRRRV
jgi:Ca2+-binding RTX toxin-like protein